MHNPFKPCWKTILLSLGCWAIAFVGQAQTSDSTKQESAGDDAFGDSILTVIATDRSPNGYLDDLDRKSVV